MGNFGPDYKKTIDGARLCTQMERIRVYMLGVEWRTLGEIERDLETLFRPCHFPQASISAQLRHLRKEIFGGHRLEKRRRKEAGLFEYRLSPRSAFQPAAAIQDELFRRTA
jgi:hypothetical protein